MTLTNYLQEHYTASTARGYGYEINNYLGTAPLAQQAVYKDVLQYIGGLRSRYSNASTLHRILSSIKAYYDFLCYTGVRSDNPARSIYLKDQRSRDIQLQDLFTADELEALLQRTERYNNLAARNKVLMSLLIYQALQPVELAALDVAAINLHKGEVMVRATPKTNQRTLTLKPNQVLLFYEYINEGRMKLLQGKHSVVLLIGMRGAPMQADEIIKYVLRSYKGLYANRSITTQTIRQSVIANLLKAGHDLSMVQLFAGHKYPSSTEKYRQHEVDDLKTAIRKYHPVQ